MTTFVVSTSPFRHTLHIIFHREINQRTLCCFFEPKVQEQEILKLARDNSKPLESTQIEPKNT